MLTNQVKLLGELLEVGATVREVCPDCKGGSTGEKSMVITKKFDGLAYICHRANCGISGFISNGLKALQKNTNNKKEIPLPKYTKAVVPLKSKQLDYLEKRYDIDRATIKVNEWQYAIEDKALYMPIFNGQGNKIGETIKIIDKKNIKDNQPKTKSYYVSKDSLSMHFPLNHDFVNPESIIVVEDMLSATKLCELWCSVAIMGVHMNPAKAAKLREYTDKLVIALDPDTFKGKRSVGHDIKSMYNAMFDSITVLKLPKDPKDMKYDALIPIFDEVV